MLAVMQFFSLYNIDLSFNRLQSIALHGIKLDKVLSVLLDLTCLPNFVVHYHITIEELDLPFDVFEIFIKEMTSKLQGLSIGKMSMNFTYLDVNQWEQLISQHIPYLSKFQFEYYEKMPSLSNDHHNLLKQFTTFFWIKQHLVL
ncbi:unnamed protein product [Rotaria socialis]|uniref:Uncharacterized protein n=1 Tax=Rotaria socialis TaxID=392032 RepID=A0A820SIT3_9BILA|nr:unnamed protein product [Rotaria socialis]CAF4453527.1 unnamed protein product [Rotaria socialis]